MSFPILSPSEPTLHRNRELESRALSHFRFHPNPSTTAFHYLLTECKPDACAGNFLSVQTLEDAKHQASVFRCDAHAVVTHREHPPFPSSRSGDVNSGRGLAPVLDRIANQVLEKVHQDRKSV